jgi:hypothetical protein
MTFKRNRGGEPALLLRMQSWCPENMYLFTCDMTVTAVSHIVFA